MTREEKENLIRELPMPEGMTRMESGPIAFGDDWPGYFLRGDDAFALLSTLGTALAIFQDTEDWALLRIRIGRAMERLRQCILTNDIEEPKP